MALTPEAAAATGVGAATVTAAVEGETEGASLTSSFDPVAFELTEVSALTAATDAAELAAVV
jgi:hypothetical protein